MFQDSVRLWGLNCVQNRGGKSPKWAGTWCQHLWSENSIEGNLPLEIMLCTHSLTPREPILFPVGNHCVPSTESSKKHSMGCAGTEGEQQGADVTNLPTFTTKSSQSPASPLAVPAQLAAGAICLLLLLPLQLPLFLLPPFVLNLGSVEVQLFPPLLRCTTKDWFLREKNQTEPLVLTVYFSNANCKHIKPDQPSFNVTPEA